MDPEELADTLQKLRDFASVNGMQWILDEVDEAISLGIAETRMLKQSTQGGRTTYRRDPEISGPRGGRRSKRSEEFISRRPMTTLEQAELLLQALRRVLVDLDDIAVGSIGALNDRDLHRQPDAEPGIAVPFINGMSFAPDEGSNAPAINTDLMKIRDRRDASSEIISQIEREIRA